MTEVNVGEDGFGTVLYCELSLYIVTLGYVATLKLVEHGTQCILTWNFVPILVIWYLMKQARKCGCRLSHDELLFPATTRGHA